MLGVTDDADCLTLPCWIEPLAATIEATPKAPVEERDEVVGW